MSKPLLAVASFSEFTHLASIVVWPLVVIVAIGGALSPPGRRLLAPVLRRVQRISGPGGFALALSPDAAVATKSDVEGGLHEYAVALKREFDRLARAENVDPLVNLCMRWIPELTRRHLLANGRDSDPACRATVHVVDALYSDVLYQLVDYWGAARGGAGRRYSTRFGMIGRAWRLEDSLEATVPVNPTTLLTEWGMTHSQAAQAGSGKQSFLCVLLRDDDGNGAPVGVFYVDSGLKDAFPPGFGHTIEKRPDLLRLGNALGRLHSVIAQRGPDLRLLDD